MFITASSLFNCEKIDQRTMVRYIHQRTSDEVLLSITNECRAQIKLYEFDSGRQYLNDIFDCSHVKMIAIKVKPGKYRIKAETYQGKSVTKIFTKGPYAQSLDIEF